MVSLHLHPFLHTILHLLHLPLTFLHYKEQAVNLECNLDWDREELQQSQLQVEEGREERETFWIQSRMERYRQKCTISCSVSIQTSSAIPMTIFANLESFFFKCGCFGVKKILPCELLQASYLHDSSHSQGIVQYWCWCIAEAAQKECANGKRTTMPIDLLRERDNGTGWLLHWEFIIVNAL